MRQSVMAYGKIAAALNEKGILSPRWFWAVHYGNVSCKYSRLWAYATVRSLLNDDVYAGTLTQNCTGSRSYKDKTMIRKPESEWISHEGAHEAIIGPELWEAVQEINQAAKQISAAPSISVYRKAGLRGLRASSGCRPRNTAPEKWHCQALYFLFLLPVCHYRT